MFVTIIAVVCHLTSTDCNEEIVTSSALDADVNFQACLVGGQAGLARWKEQHPIYRSEAWYIERYKCVPGDYRLITRHPV